jgi:hypothetical protein
MPIIDDDIWLNICSIYQFQQFLNPDLRLVYFLGNLKTIEGKAFGASTGVLYDNKNYTCPVPLYALLRKPFSYLPYILLCNIITSPPCGT